MPVTHPFVSGKPDGSDATLVQPSNWNAGHTVSIATADIANNAVTYVKIQNVTATDRLLGRDSAGSGTIEQISLEASLEFTGAGSIQRAALAGDVTAAAGSNTTAIAAGAVVDADINASGITTRSKLPAAVVYDDEVNTYTAGLKQSVSHDATNSGLRVIPAAGDPSTPADGDLWYNSTTNTYRKRQAGVTTNLDTGGGGSPGGVSGDVQFNDGAAGFAGEAAFNYNTTNNTLAVLLKPPAGTAAADTAPIRLAAGPVMTTPQTGAIEYESGVPYFTTSAGARGIVHTRQVSILTADFTLVNQVGEQSAFPTSQDVFTVDANTLYLVEGFFGVTTGATSSALRIAFLLTTATMTYMMLAMHGVTESINSQGGAAGRFLWSDNVAVRTVSQAGTQAGKAVKFSGHMAFGTGGTITPQVAFTADPTGALIMKTGSFMSMTPIGSNTFTKNGNWA